MKNYRDIEEFLGLQDYKIQEALELLKVSKETGDKQLKENALLMIQSAKEAIEKGKKVMALIEQETNRYMEARLEALENLSFEQLNEEKAKIEATMQASPATAMIYQSALDKINEVLEKTNTIISNHNKNVENIMEQYEEISVFHSYDESAKQIYLKNVLLTKEQARIYKKVENNIMNSFRKGDMQKTSEQMAYTLVYYPQIKDILPNLINYTNEKSILEAQNRYDKLKGPKKIKEKQPEKIEKVGLLSKALYGIKNAKVAIISATKKIKKPLFIQKAENFFEYTLKNIVDKMNSANKFKVKNIKHYQAATALLVATLLTPSLGFVSASVVKAADKKDNKTSQQSDKTKDTKKKTKKEEKKETKTNIFENAAMNVSYSDLIGTLTYFNNKENDIKLNTEQVASLGYTLNAQYIAEDTKQTLLEKNVISEEPLRVFINVIETRDKINNAMISYDKLGEAKKDVKKEDYFTNISSLAVNEETEKQVNTLFESLEKTYTGTEEEARAELNNFVEFMNNDEPRKDEDDYGFNYADLGTDGKLAVFMYAPNFLDKLREYDYDQDLIDNLQYELDNVADFLRGIGYDCQDAYAAVSKDGMGYNIGKVYGIEVDKDGNIVNMGSAQSFGGTTTTEEMGGYTEEVISGGGVGGSTSTTEGGNESVENVTGGNSESSTTEGGSDDVVEDVTGGGSGESTDVEEGKDETVEDTTPEGDNENTEVETPDDEEIIDGEYTEDITPGGDNENVEVETPDDEEILDGDYNAVYQEIAEQPEIVQEDTLTR